jgi:hypothetical protein
MKLQRVFSALVPACVAAVAACGTANTNNPTGSGGYVAAAGTGTGGSATAVAGAGGTSSGGAGAHTGGATSTTGGMGTGGGITAGGAPGTGGAIIGTGGSSSAGSSAGGSTAGGSSAGAGGAIVGGTAGAGGTGPSTPTEDDGTDCTIGTLPAVGSLPAIAKLPDPFTKLDGTRMTTKAEWRCRREEIRKMEEKYVYGVKPPPPQSVSGTVTKTTITVSVTDNGKTSTFSAGVKLPATGTAPYPVIIEYTTDTSGAFGPPLDPAVIDSEGVALIYLPVYSVGAEGNGHGANQQGAFYSLYSGRSATSLLTAWGWGVSRVIDVIAKSGGSILKADAVGVSGCSRFGKGALIAGVIDQRVALTMPAESGTSGLPIWRNVNAEGGQTLANAYGEQPWFGDEFQPFLTAPTKAPLDTHELVAMVAPRGLFIMDNPHIANLGPLSASIGAQAGAEVYKALGAGDAITYYSDVANGTHCSMRPEWSTPLKNNIERFLKKTGTAPGVIKISSSANGNLASWRDWTTPPLN